MERDIDSQRVHDDPFCLRRQDIRELGILNDRCPVFVLPVKLAELVRVRKNRLEHRPVLLLHHEKSLVRLHWQQVFPPLQVHQQLLLHLL